MSENVTHMRMGSLFRTWCAEIPDQCDAPIACGDEEVTCKECHVVRAELDSAELDRADCKQWGQLGHLQCGMCGLHQRPRVLCKCPGLMIINPHDPPTTETKETTMSEEKTKPATDNRDNELPWPKPISHYDSDGPRDGGPVEFSIAGHAFLVVKAEGAIAVDTGRDRYKVVCCACDWKILHEATTGASSYIETHLKKVHDYHRKLTHVEAV